MMKYKTKIPKINNTCLVFKQLVLSIGHRYSDTFVPTNLIYHGSRNRQQSHRLVPLIVILFKLLLILIIYYCYEA